MKILLTTLQSLFAWFIVTIVTTLLAILFVNSQHKDAVNYLKPVKHSVNRPIVRTIDTHVLERYREDKSKYIQFALITSLVISQTAVIISHRQKQISNQGMDPTEYGG